MRAIFAIDETEYRVFATREGEAYRVHVDDRSYQVANEHGALVVVDGDTLHVWLDGETQTIRYHDAVAYHASHADGAAEDTIVAPMPGTVTKILVAAGAAVTKGVVLAIVEAMKMEHAVKAPRDGKVKTVHFSAGDQVTDGAELLVLEDET